VPNTSGAYLTQKANIYIRTYDKMIVPAVKYLLTVTRPQRNATLSNSDTYALAQFPKMLIITYACYILKSTVECSRRSKQ